MRHLKAIFPTLFATALVAVNGAPAAEVKPADELAEMSLEDLMNVQVTSVSRTAQKASEAPAAITVITAEDIERSGMQRIPELMRLAPGMNVAQIDANKWAISARGFNEQFATKLLTLMDGRTLYHPITSGTFWETTDYLLPDLERIEIIRGPGATLWGSNAVNGVINITSKSARDTQGVLFTGTFSDQTDRNAGVRYGGKLGDDTYYRIWGKFTEARQFDDTLEDGWDAAMGGFRVDHYAGDTDSLTLMGDIHSINESDVQTSRIPGVGIAVDPYGAHQVLGNFLARWNHKISDRSDFEIQAYYDRVDRQQFGLDSWLNTVDLEMQYRFPLGDRQQIIIGGGYRHYWYNVEPGGLSAFNPESDSHGRATAFIQDDITIVPDRLHFIVGTKVEHTHYNDFNVQPSARLLWTPNENTTLWASVSRAVRTTVVVENSVSQIFASAPGPGGLPLEIGLEANPDLDSEELIAYEVGYRVKPHDRLTLDFAAFYNRHTDLRTFEPTAPEFVAGPPPRLQLTNFPQNAIDSNSYGLEAAANYKVRDNWRIAASYSLLFIDAKNNFPNAGSTTEEVLEIGEPQNQFQVHSYYDLSRNLSFDASVYYTDSLLAYNVPSNLRVDLALTWRPKDHMALKVGVQNLLDDQHPEFGDTFSPSAEIPRTVFGQLTWEF